jgi:hypothetical protein
MTTYKEIEFKFKKIMAELSLNLYLMLYKKHKKLSKITFKFLVISLISLAKFVNSNPEMFKLRGDLF